MHTLRLLPALLATLPCLAADWPQWRGPNRDAKSATAVLNADWNAKPPALLWKSTGLGEGFASVSMDAERIYTTGNRDGAQCVVAAKRTDGAVLWATPISKSVPKHGHDGSRCTPSLDGGLVYAVASDGGIACLNARDGKVVWSHDFDEWSGKMMSGWGYSESPLVDGDVVLCTPGGSDAHVVALNKATGKLVWKSPAPEGRKGNDGAGYSSLVISNGGGVKQYVTLTGKGAIGIAAKDGRLLWQYNRVANGTANIPTVLCQGDHVFTSSGYGTGAALLKLSAKDGGVQAEEAYWLDAQVFQNHHGGMVLHDGRIYAGNKHNQGYPTCLDFLTGKVLWGGETRGPGDGSAAVHFAGNHLIFRYQNGVVALIEATPDAYKLKGSFKPAYQKGNSWAHPVVVDGLLYLREQDQLMCYDLR